MSAPTLPGPPPSRRGPAGLPDRYAVLAHISSGGQGEVFRARDTHLDRVVALKVLFEPSRPEADEPMAARAAHEIRLTTRLQHRGIVAVHDAGRLDDGRLWYAMREVRGLRFDRWVAELGGLRGDADLGRLRATVQAVEQVCRTVAYAHLEGVIHCDLKPENLVVEGNDDVQVLDWGAARLVGVASEVGPDEPLRFEAGHALTLTDVVLGTPHYMSPERVVPGHRLGPQVDVYGIGVILYQALVGRLPYACPATEVLRRLRVEPPPSVFAALDSVDRDVCDLQTIVDRAMSRQPEDRYRHCGALADQLASWLRTFDERAAADRLVEGCDAITSSLETLHARRARARRRAGELLGAVQPHAPVAEKRAGWALEDDAAALSLEISQRRLELEQRLHTALSRDRKHPGAHRALAQLYRTLADEATGDHQPEVADAYVQRVARHDRGEHRAWLRGQGRLSLITAPAGARVTLHDLTAEDRRLLPSAAGVELGFTPIADVPVNAGDYVLRIERPVGPPVAYPISVERDTHWQGAPPAGRPVAIALDLDLEDDHCHVPAGWFRSGGDPLAPDGLDALDRFVDGFVVERFPVTHGRYLEFIEALLDAGDVEAARRHCPRYGRGTAGPTRLVYTLDGARARLPEDLHPELPVTWVDWHSADAFARWHAARTGRPWRLMHSLEWEKAARGVDGRLFPWGDHPEPTYANMARAHAGEPLLSAVDSFPVDESVYGVRGMAGNVRDWCLDTYRRVDVRQRVTISAGGGIFYNVRGGAFTCEAYHCRGAARFAGRPDDRLSTLGFRLARSVDR